MRASRLRLNPTNTQVMWLGSSQQLKHVGINDIPMLLTTVQVVESARDLGVILDSRLTLSAYVSALCRSGYYQLRQLRPLVQSMTVEAARSAAAAFISCRLDYCNSLLYGHVGHSAAQAAVCAERHCTTHHWHATHSPVLRELHWLPIRERVKFQVACLVPQLLSAQTEKTETTPCGLHPR